MQLTDFTQAGANYYILDTEQKTDQNLYILSLTVTH